MAVKDSIRHTGRIGAGNHTGHVVADTLEEALEWKAKYLRYYPPMGYFTKVSDPRPTPTGKYKMTVSRAGSCR
jgi:hypothetical protein